MLGKMNSHVGRLNVRHAYVKEMCKGQPPASTNHTAKESIWEDALNIPCPQPGRVCGPGDARRGRSPGS